MHDHVLAAAPLAGCLLVGACDEGGTEVTEIERKIDPDLPERAYAEHIRFSEPTVRVNPEDDDELLIELTVANHGPKTVRELDVWADFYNRNGRKAADEGELLAHDLGLGDNSAPIPPDARKRAIIEVDSPESWSGGKMVLTIDALRVQ